MGIHTMAGVELKMPNNYINADKLKRRLKSSAPLICRLCRRYVKKDKCH